jgi:hypothetical protein
MSPPTHLLLLIASYLSPLTYRHLLIASYLLPLTYRLLPKNSKLSRLPQVPLVKGLGIGCAQGNQIRFSSSSASFPALPLLPPHPTSPPPPPPPSHLPPPFIVLHSSSTHPLFIVLSLSLHRHLHEKPQWVHIAFGLEPNSIKRTLI